jgi:hypothetical protein
MLEDTMDTHFEAITWGLSEIRNFRRASGALAEAMLARGGEQIAAWYVWLERSARRSRLVQRRSVRLG